MKGDEWFRLYTSIVDDPKVWGMTPQRFRFWVGNLCLAKMNGGRLPLPREIAYRLRLNIKTVEDMIQFMLNCKLFERNENGDITPHNWDGRQYISDVSTERVKRFRERFTTVSGNVSETPRARVRVQSQSQSQSQSQNGNVASPVPVDATDVIKRMITRHPNRERAGSLDAVGRALVNVLSLSVCQDSDLAKIESNHAGWARSESWTKQNAEYCPKLTKWIAEGECFDDPPVPKDPFAGYKTL